MRQDESGRDRIIHVARQLFTERGFADVSMQQIADAAGLRKASIYHHFPSKVELFVAVSWLEIDDLHAQTTAALASADALVPQLVAVTEVWLQSIKGDRGRMMREFQEHVPHAELMQLECRMEEFLGTLATAFAQAAARGELRDISPLVAAGYFSDLVSGAVYRVYVSPSRASEAEVDVHAVAGELVDCFLFGVAAPALAANSRAVAPHRAT